MPVIGINMKTIEGKRFSDTLGPSKVNNNTAITGVREMDVQTLQGKGIAIGFDFTTTYIGTNKENYGTIKINGEVVYIDKVKHKVAMESWEKNKTLPEDINVDVLNNILRRCLIKALTIAEDLQLPPPVNLPFAKKKDAPAADRSIG